MNKYLQSGRFFASCAALALAGCSATGSDGGAEGPGANPLGGEGETMMPVGAKLESSGFASIGEVPPSSYPENPPPEPGSIDSFARRLAQATPDQQARLWEEANGPEEFQAEVQRLQPLLRQRESDNFVQLRLVRDERSKSDPKPLLGAEVWFKRDAEATLAKYTDHPMILAREGGLSESELRKLNDVWIARMQEVNWPSAISGDPLLGVVTVETGVTEDTFMKVARQRGWTWGDEVRLSFVEPPPEAFAEPRLERLVRAFTREEASRVIQLTALGTGRVILDDGCFRLAPRDGKGRGPLVMFGYDTQLALDDDGYLIVRTSDQWNTETYRIGEMGAWGGPNAHDESSPSVRALRKKCGDGELVNIGSPQSLRHFALPYADWLADYASAKRLNYREAWDEVIACYKRNEKRDLVGLELRGRCIEQFNR